MIFDEKSKTSSARIDAITIVLVAISILGLAIQFKLFSRLVDFLQDFKVYHIEEILFSLIVLSFFFGLFSYRRWRELHVEVKERERIEKAHLESEQRSNALLISIPNLTYRLRRDGTYLDFRAGNPDELISPIDNVIGTNIKDRLPLNIAARILDHVEKSLEHNSIQTLEYHLTINGKARHFQSRIIACGADEVFVLVRNLADSETISDALMQSQTRFSEVVESLSEGLLITDLLDNVMYMNQRMSELTGWKFEEVKEKPAYKFLLPEEQWPTLQQRNSARKEGISERYEMQMLHRNGISFWTEVYGSPLRDSQKNIVGTIGTITDISERRWNERLQSALYRITDITRSSHDVQELFARLHTVIGELMYAKNFYIALYDPTTKIISFPYFVDEVDPPPSPRKFSHGSTEFILETGNILHAPAPVFNEMAEHGDLDLLGAPAVDWLGVPLTSGGKTFGVMAIQSYDPKIIFTDREKEILVFVSQHIAAAVQQQSEQDRFRAIWEHSTDGMRVTDKDGMIVMVNDAYCSLVKKSAEELVGTFFQNIYQNSHEEIHSATEVYKKNFIEKTIPPHVETDIILWNGDSLSIEMSTSYITFGINEQMILSIFRNITERKQLENQLLHAQKMDSIGVLAGGIAHDFNNVLSMIMGSAELVKHKAKNAPDILKFAQMIISAAERGSGIAKQLLMFARTEKSLMKPLSISAITLDVCKLLEHSIPKAVSINTQFLTKNDIIMADEDQLHQVLINLAVNARDAIEQTKTIGMLTFKVENTEGAILKRTHPAANTGLYVSLSVSDTGCGMDEETVQRIYEPFFSTKERGKGTGLGLAIVHGITQTHHGLIDVKSAPGKGTTFTIHFPATHIVEEFYETKLEPVSLSTRANGNTSKKILIVDDEKELGTMLKEIIETEGYHAHTATDGFEALDIYEREKDHIGIVISDLGMPNMDGRELLRELLKRNPSLKFIFMTGYLDGESKTELEELGARDVLLKPFSAEDVLDTIAKVNKNIQAN